MRTAERARSMRRTFLRSAPTPTASFDGAGGARDRGDERKKVVRDQTVSMAQRTVEVDDAAQQIAEVISAERESLSLDCRADPARLERLMAPDFHEFATSGGEIRHEGTAARVAAATDLGAEPIRVSHMRGWQLADGVVMLKYASENDGRWSNRTSLWRRVGPGEWQIFHHQGTLTAR